MLVTVTPTQARVSLPRLRDEALRCKHPGGGLQASRCKSSEGGKIGEKSEGPGSPALVRGLGKRGWCFKEILCPSQKSAQGKPC